MERQNLPTVLYMANSLGTNPRLGKTANKQNHQVIFSQNLRVHHHAGAAHHLRVDFQLPWIKRHHNRRSETKRRSMVGSDGARNRIPRLRSFLLPNSFVALRRQRLEKFLRSTILPTSCWNAIHHRQPLPLRAVHPVPVSCPHDNHACSSSPQPNGLQHNINNPNKPTSRHLAAVNSNRPKQPSEERHVRSSMAMRRHRKPPDFHRSSFVIFEKDAYFLESENRLFRRWCRSYVCYQHSENSGHFHDRHGRTGHTIIPFLLWPVIRNRVDSGLSVDNSRKPKPLAQT